VVAEASGGDREYNYWGYVIKEEVEEDDEGNEESIDVG